MEKTKKKKRITLGGVRMGVGLSVGWSGGRVCSVSFCENLKTLWKDLVFLFLAELKTQNEKQKMMTRSSDTLL